MKERPILFSAPMVRAILEGRKTQTRRIINPRPGKNVDSVYLPFSCEPNNWQGASNGFITWYGRCPYGQPGDRLWVRETTVNVEEHGYKGPVFVESDEGRAALEFGLSPAIDDVTEVEPHEIRKRPAIHMPRLLSRILLEITGVSVERLNDISVSDAIAEGYDGSNPSPVDPSIKWYADLWESINGAGSWDANPWIWVIEFKVIA